jgi:putative transposase
MKQSRFSEHQIIGILKEAEAGLKVSDLSRKYGISEITRIVVLPLFGGKLRDASKQKANTMDLIRLSSKKDTPT